MDRWRDAKGGWRRGRWIASGLLGLLAPNAMAQDAQPPAARPFANPPRLESRQELRSHQPPASQPSHALMQAPMPMPSVQPIPAPSVPAAVPPAISGSRQIDFDLDVRYVKGKILDPAQHRYDDVLLRNYTPHSESHDEVVTDAPLVAPTIDVYPGQTVSVTLHNQLPPDPSCIAMDQPTNTPHCFNGTNLHSHGLWISPAGNGDNVLLSINPGVDFQYVYNLPPDHPAGTFWYHTHRHGSTALQVSSGMAGALIVHGQRPPTAAKNGDLDVILKVPDPADPKTLKDMDEQILVFQQIQYACLYKSGPDKGQVKVKTDKDGNVVAWVCDPGDDGVVESYAYPGGQGFGPTSWQQSARFTTINGQVRPPLKATAGVPQRWRMIHGGVRDTITVGFVPFVGQTAGNLGPAEALHDIEDRVRMLSAREGAQFVRENCKLDEPVTYQQIAADGLTMAQAQPQTQATLQPGYRVDALVTFPKAGQYCMVNVSTPSAGSVSRAPTEQQILGLVEVDAGAAPEPPLQDQLAAAATKVLADDPAIRDAVVADLRAGLKFGHFTPHPTIEQAEVTGRQALVFFIDIPANPNEGTLAFDVGNVAITDPHKVDMAALKLRPYDPNRIDRALKLGGVDEWTLQSAFVSHPFHIHVNPFQIVSIINPKGEDVSAPGAIDSSDPADTEYRGLKGVWKDTLWVKDLITDPARVPADLPTSMYTITIRTRYERYIGEYVLHCHILDHEDQGMMQNVSIQIPDGAGGIAMAHH